MRPEADRPLRIASLISAGTEMLFALGLGKQVVAVSHECDWPADCKQLPQATRSNVDPRVDSLAIDRQVRELIAVGAPLYEVDATLLAQLQPDLIVTQAQCDVCAVRYQDVADAVAREPRLAGTRIVSLNPESLEDVFSDMLAVGSATGAELQAEIVVAELRNRVHRARQATAAIPLDRRPRTAIIEWRDPLMLAGNWVPELLAIAGGRCDLTVPGRHSRTNSWDDLQRFDPEAIVVCPCGFDLDRSIVEMDLLAEMPGWRDTTAGRAGRVWAVDGNVFFNRPGPRLVDSLELLAGLLHPDVCRIPASAVGYYSSLLSRCK